MDYTYIIWSANTPNSPILTGASILSHPFWDTPKLYIYIYIIYIIYKLCSIHVNIQNIHKWWGARGSWWRMLPSKHGLSENAGTQWALFVRMKQHCILHHRAVVQFKFKGCGPIHWLLFGAIIPWYFSSNPNLTSINFMLASSIIVLLPHLSTYQLFINCLSKKNAGVLSYLIDVSGHARRPSSGPCSERSSESPWSNSQWSAKSWRRCLAVPAHD